MIVGDPEKLKKFGHVAGGSEGRIGFGVGIAGSGGGAAIGAEGTLEASCRGEDAVSGGGGRAYLSRPGGAVGIAELGMGGNERAEREVERVVQGREDRQLRGVGELGGGRRARAAHGRLGFDRRALRAASASRRRKLWPSIRQMSA